MSLVTKKKKRKNIKLLTPLPPFPVPQRQGLATLLTDSQLYAEVATSEFFSLGQFLWTSQCGGEAIILLNSLPPPAHAPTTLVFLSYSLMAEPEPSAVTLF